MPSPTPHSPVILQRGTPTSLEILLPSHHFPRLFFGAPHPGAASRLGNFQSPQELKESRPSQKRHPPPGLGGSTLQCDWSAPYSVTDCRKPLGPFQILRKPPLVLPGLLPDQWPQGGRLAAFLLFPSFQGSLLQIVSAWVECRPLQEEQAGQTFNLKQCFKFSLVPRDKAGTLDSLKQGELRAVRRQPSARLSSPCAAKGSCHSSSGSQPLNSEWSSCYLFMSSSFEIG